MKKVQRIHDLQEAIQLYKKQGLSIGFVPTMGFLHEGHMALVQKCKANCDVCIVSIYVNPSQFNEVSDFENYPTNFDKDSSLLSENKCDLLWYPTVADVESIVLNVNYDVQNRDQELEGQHRAGHFKGVIEVVYRLFKAVQPDLAFFGEKDFQQYKVIQAMVESNKFKTNVLSVPTKREIDGLAMSSRNVRLAKNERKIAPGLFTVLNSIARKKKLDNNALNQAKKSLTERGFEVEYLTPHEFSDGEQRIYAAVRLGNVRLIDNVAID